MKVIFSALLLLLLTASCRKELMDTPLPARVPDTTKLTSQPDTIPDGVTIKIELQNVSSSIDETVLFFDHKANARYLPAEDAPYFAGFGIAGLSSLSFDGVACAIQKLPFFKGIPIKLKIGAKNDGTFLLQLNYVNKIPRDMGIWLKDAYLKDSVDMLSKRYSFKILKSDTSSFGTERFKIVLRQKSS